MYIEINESNEHTASLSPLFENFMQRIVFKCYVDIYYYIIICKDKNNYKYVQIFTMKSMIFACRVLCCEISQRKLKELM